MFENRNDNYDKLERENQLTIDYYLNPGESTCKKSSIFRDTIVKIQNYSESDDGILLIKGFNKNVTKTIKPSSTIEFRVSGNLNTNQYINIGQTKLIISTDNDKNDVSLLNSNNCKII